MCGLRTRPRTEVHPPRVELPSAGAAYRLASPGAITCLDTLADKYTGRHTDTLVAVLRTPISEEANLLNVKVRRTVT